MHRVLRIIDYVRWIILTVEDRIVIHIIVGQIRKKAPRTVCVERLIQSIRAVLNRRVQTCFRFIQNTSSAPGIIEPECGRYRLVCIYDFSFGWVLPVLISCPLLHLVIDSTVSQEVHFVAWMKLHFLLRISET